jgi:hypothetical protein
MIRRLFGSKNNHEHQVRLPHDRFFNNLINIEYKRLDKAGHTYLDFTGGNLYAESQIQKHHQLLKNQISDHDYRYQIPDLIIRSG